jgi:uncharacterized protein YndB with AHSA1/START domain
MNKAAIFNFEVDKEKKKIKVVRSFDAPLDLVWSAWTQAELLDQWWAPKPWKAETRSMDFSEGGRWVYAMVGPDGERHNAFMDYQAIAPKQVFTSRDGFADPDGKVNESLPTSTWVNTFSEKAGTTSVTNDIGFADLAQLETLIRMGFKEGYTMGLDNLEELLARIQKESK